MRYFNKSIPFTINTSLLIKVKQTELLQIFRKTHFARLQPKNIDRLQHLLFDPLDLRNINRCPQEFRHDNSLIRP